jgi:hypothetical protein
MKTSVLFALFSGSQAVTLRSIPYASLMDEQPSHWKKIWPQGDTDDGLYDDTVIGPDAPNKLPPRVEHDWIPYEPHTTSMEN